MNFFRSIRRPRWVILSLVLLVSAVFVYAVAAQEPQEQAVLRSATIEGDVVPADQGPVIAGDRTLGVAGAADVPLGGTNEPAIAVNPLNVNNIAMADLFQLRVSTNNGASFSAPTALIVPAPYVPCGDPSLAFDSQGRLFWTYLGCTFDADLTGIDIFIAQVSPTTGAILAGYPVNVTASAGVNLPAPGNFHDKEWLAADRFPGSPFQDRLYIAWPDLTTFFGVVRTTYSTDQGQTWSAPVTLSGAGEGFVWPTHNAVAPNGDVYVAYHSQPGFRPDPNPTDQDPPNPNGTSGQVFVLRSTNGGNSYPQKTVAYTAGNASITSNLQSDAGRALDQSQSWTQGSAQAWVLPDPVTPGNVYVVAADDPTNTADGGANDDMAVFIVRSTNSGVSWGAPVQIDSGPGSSHQFFPTAAIDYTSRCLSVTWYDSRSGAKNANGNFLLDVFIRSSPDGGVTFGPEVQLNDAAFDPDLGAPQRWAGPPPTLRIGEYNGVAVINGTAHAVWTGNTGAGQQIFYDSAIACSDADDDNDGLPDTYENAHLCLDPLVADADADPDSDTLSNLTEFGLGTDPCAVDTDQDGCSDGEEVAPKSAAALGGGRNPLYFWDFFDPEIDISPKGVSFLDLLAVLQRINTTDDGGLAPINRFSDPIDTPDQGPGNYHPRFDRGLSFIPGGNLWEEMPADGFIGFHELLSLLRQFNHSCMASP